MKPLLEISNLTISANNKIIINDFNLKINKGDKIVFFGHSGSGKTTLAKAIINTTEKGICILKGSINYNRINILQLKNKKLREIRGKEIGYIFQSAISALNPSQKIINQIYDTYLSHYKKNKKEIKNESINILLKLGFYKEEAMRILNSYPLELSGGQAARVYVLMVVILKPKLIIADETFTEIDKNNKCRMLEFFNQLCEDGCSIILISHNISIVNKFSKNIIYL